MKFLIFSLLVSLTYFSLTNADEEECSRTWKEDNDTNLSKIFGQWYTYLQDKHLVENTESCSEYLFTWNKTMQLVNLLNTQTHNDNVVKSIKGIAYTTQKPGQFDVKYENGLELVVYAVSVNENYSFFSGCFKGKDMVRIITKDKIPSDAVKEQIEQKIKDHHVTRSQLVHSCQD